MIAVSVMFRKWLWLLFLIPIAAREALYHRLRKQVKPVFNQFFWVPELLVVLGAAIYCIYMGMNDPFLYFRF